MSHDLAHIDEAEHVTIKSFAVVWIILLVLTGIEVLLAYEQVTPVIMLTMVNDPERGFTLGAVDIAIKPVDRARLSQIEQRSRWRRRDLAATPNRTAAPLPIAPPAAATAGATGDRGRDR